ncbi:TonB-dependent receptor [Niabella sp.]|uniref:TonB-dependent receptor n=1 Tax=Niabella sp. TaxID=1962976 RepID=UPI00262DBA19|nr:TonB-dependent receptor [Niabella sp.]
MQVKLTTVLLIATMVQVSARGFAQKVTLSQPKITVKQVFREIKRQTGYDVFYLPEIIKDKRVISVRFFNTPLAEVMKQTLAGQELSFTIFEKSVIIKEREKTALDQPEVPLKKINVNGKVVDEKNNPLFGASVTVKGSQKGTSSSREGAFSLQDIDDDAVLIVSYVGFKTQEVPVASRTTIHVVLTEEKSDLSELVVVGYGRRKKMTTTGAMASVKSSELMQTPVVNVAQGLQGRVSGVQVTQNSAAPGGNISVRVRGANSINGSSEPLYVVDGIPLTNSGGINDISSLSAINPNDIESVEILKDASSTAIYGARGSNGVMLITTKRGKEGRTRVSYEGFYGTQQVSKKLDLLNAAEFAALENEIYKTNIYPDPASLGEGVDWQNLIFRTAPMQSHQVAVSGGNQKTQMMLSLNYFDQKGVVLNTDFKRYSLRLNLDHRINDRFRTGISILGSYNINNNPATAATDFIGIVSTVLGATVGAPPTLQPYRADGSFFPFLDQMEGRYKEVINPLGLTMRLNRQKLSRTLTNLYAEASILPELKYRASLNIILSSGLGDFYSPLSRLSAAEINATSGSARKENSNSTVLLHESLLTYDKQFGKDHALNITGLFSTQTNLNDANAISSSGFPNDATLNEALQLALTSTVSSSRSREGLDSYMGRVHYGFRNKYLLDVTARVDGATKFGRNNKYGYFPSAAAAWRIKEERFMKNVGFISDLKLRVSYGVTGNAASISPYKSLPLVGAGGGYSFNHIYLTSISPTAIANSNLRWEKSAQADIGLDIGLLSNCINVVIDVYDKNTKDLLYVKSLPLSSGYSSITGNFAGIDNKGLEFAVNARILDAGVKWNLGGNISFNRNKVTGIDGGLTDELFVNNYTILKLNSPLGLFKTYVFDGIYQTGETILPGSDSRTGGTKIKDLNNDGQITALDQTITGDPNPDYIFGIATDLNYKKIDFSMFISGSQGNDIYNISRNTYENPLGQRNTLSGVRDRWSPSNPSNEFVSGFQGGRLPITNRFIEDGSFVRFKNITLGYTLPLKKGLSNMRVYVSANNLFTITKYSGYDPEVNSFGNSNTQIGIDNLVYPSAKSFIAGIQVNL